LGAWYGKDEARRAYDSWGHTLLDVFDELATPSNWRQVGVITGSRLIEDRQRVMVPTDNERLSRGLTHMLGPGSMERLFHATGIYELFGRAGEPVQNRRVQKRHEGMARLKKYRPFVGDSPGPDERASRQPRLGRAIHHTDERSGVTRHREAPESVTAPAPARCVLRQWEN